MSVQAIDKMNAAVGVFPEDGANVKEAQRLQPEVIGCEIVNPRIDEKDVLREGHNLSGGGSSLLENRPRTIFQDNAEGGTRTHTALRP